MQYLKNGEQPLSISMNVLLHFCLIVKMLSCSDKEQPVTYGRSLGSHRLILQPGANTA